MITGPNPLCIALDTSDLGRAVTLAKALAGTVGYVKLGMEFYYAHGPKGYEQVAATGVPVFLDLKLHDIPNTVAQGLTCLMKLDPVPAIVNVHASGGRPMLTAAADAVAGRARLIAVTILTSLSDSDIHEAGYDPARSTAEQARDMALLVKTSGLDGVVCSPLDIANIKQVTGPGFLTIVPGIRPADSAAGDQKRIATPASAMAAGADILVIGRPVTGADDPVAAAHAILESLHGR
jgi:orotidine-5'-phosphate decarboxylase